MEGGNDEYKKGLWTVEEDTILMDYIRVHGKGKWNRVNKLTGLKRCGKSCRLRWMNYLSPSVKQGGFSEEEDDLIIRLHKLLGNRWSLIAGRVPGRTDNQVKNHWNTHLSKKLGVHPKKAKATKPKTSFSDPPKQLVKPNFCMASSASSDQSTSDLQHPTTVPNSNNDDVDVDVDDDDDHEQNIIGSTQSDLWEAVTMSNNNNNVDSNFNSSSFWFYNDDLNNLCSPYFLGPSLDDQFPLSI